MFDSIIKTQMLEGDLVFVNNRTNEIFLVMHNYDWENNESKVGHEECSKWLSYCDLDMNDIRHTDIVYVDSNITVRFLDA